LNFYIAPLQEIYSEALQTTERLKKNSLKVRKNHHMTRLSLIFLNL